MTLKKMKSFILTRVFFFTNTEKKAVANCAFCANELAECEVVIAGC